MSLRVRMGLAAGLAVALAVIAVAVSAYAGTSSELKGQVDNSLHSITSSILAHGGGPPGGRPGGPGSSLRGASIGGGGSDNFNDSSDPDEGLGLGERGGPAFGGAAGALTLVRRDGTTFVPRGQSQSIPVDARARALAAKGSGQYFTEMDVNGTHIRVLATGVAVAWGPAGRAPASRMSTIRLTASCCC